ncbi:MAG TPA: hypothetical protein GXX38_05555 [Clostridia bacterium]|nr:hypothetical protein [Clostridia bacterium]
MEKYLQLILVSIIIGTLTRFVMLKIDYRRYPSYPHGYIVHLGMGLVASALGAVALPSILEKDFTAVTFLALATQQFREIRKMERDTLGMLEQNELVKRGEDYIEGIAKVFEGRNYLTIFNSLLVSICYYWGGLAFGIGAGSLGIIISVFFRRGKRIGQIAHVRSGEIRFEGANLYVENIHIMNVGLTSSRKIYLEKALGAIIEPYDDNARATLANVGQRMAICHDAASLLGVHKDVATPEFMPTARLDLDTGRVGVVIVPIEKDLDCFLEAIRRTPVLESAVRKPMQTQIGRIAAD